VIICLQRIARVRERCKTSRDALEFAATIKIGCLSVTGIAEMEGLSGFDRSMMKRLESSALTFYGLKHQQMQYQEPQCSVRGVCDEAVKTNGAVKYQRQASDTSSSSSSSSSSTAASPLYSRRFSSNAAQITDTVKREHSTSDTEDSVPVTQTPTHADCSPRTTADGQGSSMSSSCISFSISRILGQSNTPPVDSRGPSQPVGRSTPVHVVERSRRHSGMTSPDSSCRVAGDDFDHDVKKSTDSDDSDDDVINDNDVNVVKLQTAAQSSASAAAAVCGDTLHGLSWLQCTRYKPPKLPSKNH